MIFRWLCFHRRCREVVRRESGSSGWVKNFSSEKLGKIAATTFIFKSSLNVLYMNYAYPYQQLLYLFSIIFKYLKFYEINALRRPTSGVDTARDDQPSFLSEHEAPSKLFPPPRQSLSTTEAFWNETQSVQSIIHPSICG